MNQPEEQYDSIVVDPNIKISLHQREGIDPQIYIRIDKSINLMPSMEQAHKLNDALTQLLAKIDYKDQPAPEYTEHMAEILYRKITNEDDMFVSLCEIVEHLADIPGLRERIEKLS